jgi:hypothetical protein
LVDKVQFCTPQPHRPFDRDRIEDRWIKRRSFKGIAESFPKPTDGIGPRMNRYRAADMMRDLAEIVDAMAMIGMIVRDDHAVDFDQFGRQQLFAHVRPTIDQQPFPIAFDQDRRARSPVF